MLHFQNLLAIRAETKIHLLSTRYYSLKITTKIYLLQSYQNSDLRKITSFRQFVGLLHVTYNLMNEREKYKKVADEMEKTFAELSVY